MAVVLPDTGDEAQPTPGASSPPYSSFASLLRLFDSLRDNGLPARLDRSYFGNQSGGLVSQTRKTLAFFKLMDEEYRPTEELRQLVGSSDDERKAILRALTEERYADEIELARKSGTAGQLLELLRMRGLSGATGRKAATFYIHLSEYTGLPVSSYFAQARTSPSGGAPINRRSRRRKESTPEAPSPATSAGPETSRKVQEAKYIEMLMDMAGKSAGEGAPSTDLLNRIERMLGHEPPDPEPDDQSEVEGDETSS